MYVLIGWRQLGSTLGMGQCSPPVLFLSVKLGKAKWILRFGRINFTCLNQEPSSLGFFA